MQSGTGFFASTLDTPGANIDDGNAVVTALRVGMNLVFRHHSPPLCMLKIVSYDLNNNGPYELQPIRFIYFRASYQLPAG